MAKTDHYILLTTVIKRKAARARTLTELNRVCREIEDIRSNLATLRWEVERTYDRRVRREAALSNAGPRA